MKFVFLLIGWAFLHVLSAEARGDEEAEGLRDACVAGTILGAHHIRHEVIEVGHEAGCIYDIEGVRYIYTPSGSARLNSSKLARVAIRRISAADAFRIADGGDEIRNGCLVFATCAFAECRSNAQVVWAGIVTAHLIGMEAGGEGSVDVSGHALMAFENSDRQIFLQENGHRAYRVRQLTRLAQKGDRSWYDPSMLLLYSRQGTMGTAAFVSQFGEVR